MKLGCIADDFTGATDLANNLVRSGMRTVQTIGVPEGDAPAGADAVVVALKSLMWQPEHCAGVPAYWPPVWQDVQLRVAWAPASANPVMASWSNFAPSQLSMLWHWSHCCGMRDARCGGFTARL